MKKPILYVKTFRSFITIIVLILASSISYAQGLKVAAAANLQPILKALQSDFYKRTGVTIEPIVGASGNLVAQISNGAPYDLFLSADMEMPENLYKKGLTTTKPTTYASGKLIICSNQNIGFENWERLLMTGRIKKIAVANPSIAPYGKAAVEAIQHKGLWVDVKSKIVYGESISQVNTYITTGVVEVGFTTQSLVDDPSAKKVLYWKAINPKIYSPIKQGMVILKHAENNKDAEKLYTYLLSAPAKAIFAKYGYGE
jgi:molybdate transport system substrate-binding protein